MSENQYTYWTPEELPLPTGSKTLFWHSYPVDLGVIWLTEALAEFTPSGTPVEPWAIPQNILEAALLYEHRDTQPPKWAQPYRHRERSEFRSWRTWYTPLPLQRLTEELFIVGMPMLGDFIHGQFVRIPADTKAQTYLLFRKRQDGRFALFPRSLRARFRRSYTRPLFTKRTVDRLAPEWISAIDALPKWALTEEHRQSGLPVIFGIKDKRSSLHGCTLSEAQHEFWRLASRATLALLTANGSRLPPPPENATYAQFLWAVIVQYLNPRDGEQLCQPSIKLSPSWSGWGQPSSEESPGPTSPQDCPNIVSAAEKAASLISEMAKETTKESRFLLDGFSPARKVLEDQMYSEGCFAYFHLKWGPKEHQLHKSRHGLLELLSGLPQSWRKAAQDYI